jgi:hypothetical protein
VSYQGYDNQIEFIKAEFGKFYVDKGPENGILQGTKYQGAATHARNCLYTLTKMLKPLNALEIGSLHYASSDAIANAMDENGTNGVVDSFDIKKGGYDGQIHVKPSNARVRPGYWYPFPTYYDTWKFTDKNIVYPQFQNMSKREIRETNRAILAERCKDFGKYDLIFVDGDHSYDGAKEDYELALQFSHKDTVIVIDNVWDIRLNEVRQFYDSLNFVKWDFEEWNDANYAKNMVMDNAVTLTY